MKKVITMVFAFIIVSLYGQTNDSIFQKPEDLIGQKMPELSETSITGNQWNKETLKGKVILINFWFIGCPPCMKEIPYLNDLKSRYNDEEFVLLSVAPHVPEDLMSFNCDSANQFSAIRKYLANSKIEYEIIAECENRTVTVGNSIGPDCNRISSKFNVRGYPTTFIINKEGIIEYAKTGFSVNMENLQEKVDYNPGFTEVIERLLSKKTANTK